MKFCTKVDRSNQEHAKKNGFVDELVLLDFTISLTSND